MADFALDIEKFVRKTRTRLDLTLQKVTFDLGSQLMTPARAGGASPVDLGFFINNWNVSLNQPDFSVSDPANPGANAATLVLESVAASAQFGDTVYITNGTEYGPALENGHSKQAPNGVVKITVANYPGVVARSVAGAKQERP